MDMIPVRSSSLMAIGYDPDRHLLRVVFKAGGAYDYHGIPENIYKQLMSSPSKGKFYSNFIKGRFSPQRIR